jgi:isochorismate hydrolase
MNNKDNFKYAHTGCGSVVMDMQDSLLQAIEGSNQLQSSVILQLKIFNLLNLKQCLTEQVPLKLGRTKTDILNVDSSLPVFSKDTFSAFGCEDFVRWAKGNDINHLFISGIETPICIYQTCLSALRENLKVTVISDCIGARRSSDGSIILSQLVTFGCHVMPLETVVYSMLESSHHPEFRSVSKLITNRL